MTRGLFENLHEEGDISPESLNKIKGARVDPLISLHWEIKLLLYLGVMLLSSGLGILIYKNIDTLGHQVILALIALIGGSCFFYCSTHKKPFSRDLVSSPGSFFDYVLLLGCLSLLTFVGYLQAQYVVFGNSYGLATFIPMVVLFYVAYRFDHLGILSLAIANLALWLGVSVTPFRLIETGDFESIRIILTYLGLGLLLIGAAYLSEHLKIKAHFRFTYLHFGTHLSFISLLAGYFNQYDAGTSVFWLLVLCFVSFYVYRDAMKHRSFYFLLLMVLYTYVAVSSLLLRMLFHNEGEGSISLGFMYFIGSAIGLVFLLINLNKQFKAK